MTDESTRPQDLGELPDLWSLDTDRERMLEVYAYNIFGERAGVMHCTDLTTGAYAHPGYAIGTECKASTRIYDYVDAFGNEIDEKTILLLHFDRILGGAFPDDSGARHHGWAVGRPTIARAER